MYSLPNFSEQLTSETLMRPIIGKWIWSEEHIKVCHYSSYLFIGIDWGTGLLIITSDWSRHMTLWKTEVPKADSYLEENLHLARVEHVLFLYPFQCESLAIKLEWILISLLTNL